MGPKIDGVYFMVNTTKIWMIGMNPNPHIVNIRLQNLRSPGKQTRQQLPGFQWFHRSGSANNSQG